MKRKREKQLIIEMSADLHKRFKLACVKDGKTMTEVVVSFIEEWVHGKESLEIIRRIRDEDI